MDKIVKGYPNWDIPLNANINEYNETIGNAELLTKDKTVKGSINEIKTENDAIIQKIKDDTQINTADISNLKTSVAQNATQLNDMANKSSIVNNCNVTEAGFIADARQLNFLFNLINKIKIIKIYPAFSSGEATYTINGIKNSSCVMATLNHPGGYTVKTVIPSDDNVRIIMTDTAVNGPVGLTLLYVL